MKNFKKNATKNSSTRYHKEHFLNHLAHIQVQVLKKYEDTNEAIIEWSANFKKVFKKNPTENHMKKDPVIAKTWRKNKVATELLKIWKITIHLLKLDIPIDRVPTSDQFVV